MTSSLPEVVVRDGRPVVSSLRIADHFEKKHKNVLRDIRELLEQLPDGEQRLNFEPLLAEVHGPNNSIRKVPAYELTRDGFTLLAMGFTGKEALAWKLRYIQAFNAMEAELRRRDPEPKPAPLPRETREALKRKIRSLLNSINARKRWGGDTTRQMAELEALKKLIPTLPLEPVAELPQIQIKKPDIPGMASESMRLAMNRVAAASEKFYRRHEWTDADRYIEIDNQAEADRAPRGASAISFMLLADEALETLNRGMLCLAQAEYRIASLEELARRQRSRE